MNRIAGEPLDEERSEAAEATHRHDFKPWITFHHAPIGPYPEHTAFTVLLCAGCGAWSCWPSSNYALVTPSFRQLLERAATEAGFFLMHELETHFVDGQW